MAESLQDGRHEDSQLQSLLPSLTNEEIEEMYHSKIKLVLDKSITSSYQKNLEEEIYIIAVEMKARNMDMRSRSPSRKSKILPLGSSKEKYKTLMDIEKEKKGRVGYPEAKPAICPDSKSKEPKSKYDTDSMDKASTVHKEVEMPPDDAELKQLSIIDKIFEEERKKVVFNVLSHMKEVESKLQPVQYYKPRKQKNEFKPKQMYCNKPQEKQIIREQIHYGETKKRGMPLEREEIGSDESDDEENQYTFVGTAGRFKLVETLYQNTRLEDESDFALIDGSSETIRNQKKKLENDVYHGTRARRDKNSNSDRNGKEEEYAKQRK